MGFNLLPLLASAKLGVLGRTQRSLHEREGGGVSPGLHCCCYYYTNSNTKTVREGANFNLQNDPILWDGGSNLNTGVH
jgi:hypothetical protein